jgi:plasmid stabilization system protein ParE
MPGSPRRLRFHPAARAELLEAEDWYLKRSVRAAGEFVREVDHALTRIREAPDRYPETRYGRRRFVLLNFPFDLVYRITDHEVEIIAVAHHSRRPAYWRSR